MPGNVSVGPAGGAWARSNSSGGEEVAGSRVRELLEEGGEGALTGLGPGLECLQNRLWQAGLGPSKKEKERKLSTSFQIAIDMFLFHL